VPKTLKPGKPYPEPLRRRLFSKALAALQVGAKLTARPRYTPERCIKEESDLRQAVINPGFAPAVQVTHLLRAALTGANSESLAWPPFQGAHAGPHGVHLRIMVPVLRADVCVNRAVGATAPNCAM